MLTKAEIIDGLDALTAADRSEILAYLTENFDKTESVPEPLLSAEWRNEIGRRIDEYRSGNVQSIPAETVRSDTEVMLAKLNGAHAS